MIVSHILLQPPISNSFSPQLSRKLLAARAAKDQVWKISPSIIRLNIISFVSRIEIRLAYYTGFCYPPPPGAWKRKI